MSRIDAHLSVPDSIPIQLGFIPAELFEKVMGYLDWKDILAMQKTCRFFYQVSLHRYVWQHVFLRNLATGKFPRNFFLSRPLLQCSSLEIESLVKRWQMPWPDPVPMGLSHKTVSLDALEGRSIKEKHYVPGGRWFILVCNDGSTWSLDLVDPKTRIAPRPLTPSPYHYGSSPQDARIWVATEFDFISHQQEHPTCYYLHSFTFATASRRWGSDPGYQSGECALVNVWRVEVISEGPLLYHHNLEETSDCGSATGVLTAVEHLSSFREMRFLDERLVDKSQNRKGAMSLLGRHIAYPIFHDSLESPCVAIVDWQQANGVTDWRNLVRWCIPDCHVNTMQLLPHSQILIGTTDLSGNVLLYCWKQDCPNTSTTPLEIAKKQRISPAWSSRSRFVTSPGCLVDVGCRYLVEDGVRCLISVRSHRAWLQVTSKPGQNQSTMPCHELGKDPIVTILDTSASTRRNTIGGEVGHPPGYGFLRSLDRVIRRLGKPCVSEWCTDSENSEWQNVQRKAIDCGEEIKQELGIVEDFYIEGQFDEYSSKVIFYDDDDLHRVCVAQILPR